MPTTSAPPPTPATSTVADEPRPSPAPAVVGILFALSFGHLLNDAIQALLPAIYPLLKDSLHLSFTQIGLITLTFHLVGSIFQPLVGLYTDRHPKPFSLIFGMGLTFVGVVILALAPSYLTVLVAAALIGSGSAVFHPEASRMARLASGGRHGFAQSLFQVGGNVGTAMGPLLAAGLIVPRGQRHILWFSAFAVAGMLVLGRVGRWYQKRLANGTRAAVNSRGSGAKLARRTLAISLVVLLLLMFSKFIYLASMTSYYTFYLLDQFGVSVQQSQFYLFLFLGAGALGTLAGGPLGDRIGRKRVIWLSILGIAPFSLALPYAGLHATALLSVVIAAIMASAFPAILVYATELLPGRVGLIAGLFFGLAFGLAGIGSALLGKLADATSIKFVVEACSYLPLIGLLTWFLPDLRSERSH